MRQLIIAAVTLIVLTAASSTLALRSQSQLQSWPRAPVSAAVLLSNSTSYARPLHVQY
jgi:hypothetical protein